VDSRRTCTRPRALHLSLVESESAGRPALRGRLKSCLGRSPGAKPAASSTRRLCGYPHPQPLSWKGEGSRKHQSPPRIFRLPSPSRRGAGGEVAILRSSLLPMSSLSSPRPSPLPTTITCLTHQTANPDML
jgi:hypothetical protein